MAERGEIRTDGSASFGRGFCRHEKRIDELGSFVHAFAHLKRGNCSVMRRLSRLAELFPELLHLGAELRPIPLPERL